VAKSGKTLAILALFLCAGCAVAPLSNHISARTNGRSESLLSAGSTIGAGNRGWVPSIKYSVGLSDSFDLGFQYEVVEYGAWGKYQLLGGREGFALAGLAGMGLSFTGFYGYLGPVLSWKSGIFEPYFVERVNYVDYPEASVNVQNVGEVHVDPGSYRYLQHTLGFFLWPVHSVGFGLEASAFTTLGSPFILRGSDRFLLSGQVSVRF
jgi:hypothetical protein